jgi:hypothetical protein
VVGGAEFEFAGGEEARVGVGQRPAEVGDQGGLVLGLGDGLEGGAEGLGEEAGEAVGGFGGVVRLDVGEMLGVERVDKRADAAVYELVVEAGAQMPWQSHG